MYSIEMAYARMRELQDQANRSRANTIPTTGSRRAGAALRALRAKKR
ncbi:hypothetical protein AB0K09_03295 [Streptomyces sp. NPDC049577]